MNARTLADSQPRFRQEALASLEIARAEVPCPIRQLMTLIDENNELLPEGVYLELCKHLLVAKKSIDERTTRDGNNSARSARMIQVSTMTESDRNEERRTIVIVRPISSLYEIKGDFLQRSRTGKFEIEFACAKRLRDESADDDESTDDARFTVMHSGYDRLSGDKVRTNYWTGRMFWNSGDLSDISRPRVKAGTIEFVLIRKANKFRVREDSMRELLREENEGELRDIGQFFDELLAHADRSMNEMAQGQLLFVEKMKIEDRFKGLGLPMFALDMADRTINAENSLIVMDPFFLMRDFCNDEMIQINAATDGDDIITAMKTYYAKVGMRSLNPSGANADDKYIARFNGHDLPELKNVCPHLFR